MVGVFDLTFVTDQSDSENRVEVLKVLHPTLTLAVLDDCPLCHVAQAFFEAEPSVRLRVRRARDTGDLPPPGRKSSARSAAFPALTYRVDGVDRPVPLPELHDGAKPSTLTLRLRRHFRCQIRPLRDHQRDLLQRFEGRSLQARHTPAFTVMWQMGSGKTLGATSLLVAQRVPRSVVVANNTNIGYWVEHLRLTPFAPLPGGAERDVVLRVTVMGYAAFRQECDAPGALRRCDCLVLDEAHYFRNHTQGMQMAMAAVRGAKNVLLLTGTPLVNAADDAVGMLALTDTGRTARWEAEHEATGTLPTPAQVQAFLQGHVSWFDPRLHQPLMFARHYPTLVDEVVRVPMSWPQTLEYLLGVKAVCRLGPAQIHRSKSNRYNCLTRAICNAPTDPAAESPKLREVCQRVRGLLGQGPQVVHSSLVESGIKRLHRMCLAADDARLTDATMGMITGSTPNEARETIRTRYNRGRLAVLFISDASQFGLDLVATRAIHLVEPHRNLSTESQTTARATRMGSHTKCDYSTVLRFKYVSTFPSGGPSAGEVAAVKAAALQWDIVGRDTAEFVESLSWARELRSMVKAARVTVNEQQEADNVDKHAGLLPYLKAYEAAGTAVAAPACSRPAKRRPPTVPSKSSRGPPAPKKRAPTAAAKKRV